MMSTNGMQRVTAKCMVCQEFPQPGEDIQLLKIVGVARVLKVTPGSLQTCSIALVGQKVPMVVHDACAAALYGETPLGHPGCTKDHAIMVEAVK